MPDRAPIFRSPRSFDFQIEAVVKSYVSGDSLLVFDTGLGKSVCAMMLSALLFEDDLIDHVVVVCELNKVDEWFVDFGFFTPGLSARRYRGALSTRVNIANDLPEVIIGTYETFRNDLAKRRSGKPRALDPEFLLDALQGKRVLLVYDEMGAKLKNRSSGNYRHQEYALKQLRKGATTRTLGLTATPIERDPENVFNLARLLNPGILRVTDFERDYIVGFDEHRRPIAFKNLSPQSCQDPWIPSLSHKLSGVVQIKSKLDEDVRSEFPEQVEQFTRVDMLPLQDELYRTVAEIAEAEDIDAGSTMMALRLIALLPEAIALSQSGFSRRIVEVVGEAGLRAVGSAKVDRLLASLDQLVNTEGLQVVVFTWFGQTVLPILAERLRAAGYSIAVQTGGMSADERAEERARFASGEARVYLSSDAGSRGVNLAEASWVINFELPTMYSTYVQRSNRHNRINSDRETTFVESLISARTIEEPLAMTALERNEWFNTFTERITRSGDAVYELSPAERRALLYRDPEESP